MTSPDRDARSLSQDAQQELRVRAVKMRLDGVSQVEVADNLGVSTRIVRSWERRYRPGWLEGACEAASWS